MNQKRGTSCYQVGGSLGQESACYVERKADRELELALDRGQFCYVLNSRQMGKSSLRIRAMAKLQAKQTVCIFIDLTGMGTQDLTPEKWYAGIVRSIVSSCQLEFNWRKWWRDRRDLLAPVQRLNLFIEEVLLDRVTGKIAIFVDEIDRVLSQSFSLDDFFALIHSCYQKRQVNPAYDRLTFTLLGVAAPRDLIRDKTQSPFDAGKAIVLEGFKLEEAAPLTAGLLNSTVDPQQLLAAILDWTGGQPFLTQKLCQLVGENPNCAQKIVNIIQENIVTDWETKDEPEHLRTIRDRLCYRDPSKTIRLLGLYRKILQQETIKSDRSLEQTELRLSGLVVEKGGNLIVNNPIYGWIFNLAWVDRELEKLRPYSKAIACWIESDRSDQSYLLRGKELQEALTWSLDKSLADVDYQFLVASQNQAKQEIQDALTAVTNASGLLATARKKARRKARKKRLSKRLSSAIAFGAAASIIVLRHTGILQSWEWNLLDRFFSWRLSNNIEPHITAITIDEKDIQQAGQWPIPDGIIATAIKNIKTHRPKAIALDIYKDLPAQPGTKELLKLYNSNRDIYAVEKLIGNPILHPAIPQQQVGFTDQTLDSDGKIRRALLSLVTDDRQRFSLGTQVALDYLKDKDIELEPIGNHRYRLGKAVFKRFQSSDGGYVDADSGGYQILLNYWGTEDNFQQYSLTQVLKGRVAPETIRDRIIFIGSTAESIKDNFYTPYSFGWFGSPPKMPGVFIHANVASQIINAAMYDRPLLRTCDRAIEYLWLLFWGINGAIIVWIVPRSWGIFISVLLTSILLIVICYVAFILGWWMPLVPALLTLWTTIAIALSIRNKLRDSLKFQYTLDFLLQHRDRPLETKVAIEYLKQSENQANQASIESKTKDYPSV